jgi:hypothetical protein
MKAFFLLLFVLVSFYVDAQTSTLPVEGSIREVKFIDLAANVEIRGTDDNEITIFFGAVDSSDRETRKPGTGSNLASVGLGMKREGSAMVFKGEWSKSSKGKYIIDLPARLSVNVQADPGFTTALHIKGIEGKLDIRTYYDVEIAELANGLVLKNPSGNVKITANKNLRNPVSVITESGDVNFNMSISQGADLKLGTGTGAVMAVLTNGRKGLITFNGKMFHTPVNGGGTVVQIQSLSGDVKVSQYK